MQCLFTLVWCFNNISNVHSLYFRILAIFLIFIYRIFKDIVAWTEFLSKPTIIHFLQCHAIKSSPTITIIKYNHDTTCTEYMRKMRHPQEYNKQSESGVLCDNIRVRNGGGSPQPAGRTKGIYCHHKRSDIAIHYEGCFVFISYYLMALCHFKLRIWHVTFV